MAHLVFIHGINNQIHYPRSIAENWWNYLVEGWIEHGLGPIPKRPKITVGYYAQRLYAAAHGELFLKYDPYDELPNVNPSNVVSQGADQIDSSGDGLELLREYANHYNEELPKQDVVHQGFMKQALIKIADELEDRLNPKVAKNLARAALGQAAVYCDAEGIRNGIQQQVMRQISEMSDPLDLVEDLGDEPIILVTHSLGTVVGYRMLFEEAAQNTSIPLFVTLGSPLSVKFIKKSVDENPLVMPSNVIKWVNGYSNEDVVALGNPLGKDEIGFSGIENILIEGYQPQEKPHDIRPHLKAHGISHAIYKALTA